MTYKLKSTKLWLTILLIAFVGFLNYSGTVDGDTYIDFIKWALVIFTAGNVGTKAVAKKVNQ